MGRRRCHSPGHGAYRCILSVPVLAMGTALAHMLRADVVAVDARDSRRTGPPAVLRSLSWSPMDQDNTAVGSPDLDPWPAGPQMDQARDRPKAHRTRKPVSRRALRGAGVTGSNEALIRQDAVIRSWLLPVARVD
jgi:hypothetical protein